MWIDDNVVQPVSSIAANVGDDLENFDRENTSEQIALNSNYFSAYKNKLVIRLGIDTRSGSLGILFIDPSVKNNSDGISTVQHEYGHTKQLDQIGIIDYLLFIGIPSVNKLGSELYYRKPWEITADIYGGVNLGNRYPASNPVKQDQIDNGKYYMDVLTKSIPIWEKYELLEKFYK